ncbi:MAG: hypothetical protein M1826_003253 [Phylliscum demangeonii]|nr:MAG: hypothetical protein M1826_003253 [Phylliscum demangeonii]
MRDIGGGVVVCVNAKCTDDTVTPGVVYVRELDKLRAEKIKPTEYSTFGMIMHICYQDARHPLRYPWFVHMVDVSLPTSLSRIKRVSSDNKTIPTRLLPFNLAAEDSLRQLIILALMDQILVDVMTWQELEELPSTPDRTLIRMKETA